MAAFNGARQLKPSSVPYFYGRITRDEAEIVLKERSCYEGMFLLRESINPLGNYAISLCHEGKVHHYSIEKQTDGMYMIPAGRKFLGPVELILHHQHEKDGIITQLTVACDRSPDQTPVAFRGMTYSDLEQELVRKADSIKGVNKERALGAQREHLVIMVAKDLHTKQPWYHGKINRSDSEKRLKASGHKDGKFLCFRGGMVGFCVDIDDDFERYFRDILLDINRNRKVRARDDKKTFAVCISFQNDTRHYLIDKNQDNKFGIQDGPKFDCIMMLIDHYHNKQDGLLCKLTEPCPSPGFDPQQLRKYTECNVENLVYLRVGQSLRTPVRPGSVSLGPSPPVPGGLSTPPPVPSSDRRPSLKDRLKTGLTGDRNQRRALPPTPEGSNDRWLNHGDWEGDQSRSNGFDSRRVAIQGLNVDAEGLEGIYGSIPRTLEDFDLKKDQIDLQETLGSGQFGSVCKGMCTLRGGKKVPVAVKTLKTADCQPSQEPELIKEAKIMMPLSHKHIVRMIGLCKADSIMLVLELAPLGQLNSFLHSHKETTPANIVELLWQVAMGMEYLESKKFVHRDLAARNVLLVSEHFAKISDFGMSKALARDNNYYEATAAGKWPLKWYAPECVYYWKFDSKSDVWSYGVTMWEATSYGDRPYKKMKGQEILQFLVEEGKRLEKPEHCDENVYEVMLRCWEYDKTMRPTFSALAKEISKIYRKMSRR